MTLRLRLFKFILILSIIYGCSAEWHLKRVIKKNPNIFDTSIVQVVDTILTKDVKIDTVLVSNKLDTFIIEKEKFFTKIYKHFDTIRVEGGCKNDTVVYVKEVKNSYNLSKYFLLEKVEKIIMRIGLLIFFILIIFSAIRLFLK